MNLKSNTCECNFSVNVKRQHSYTPLASFHVAYPRVSYLLSVQLLTSYKDILSFVGNQLSPGMFNN